MTESNKQNLPLKRKVTKWECKCPQCGQVYHRTNTHPYLDSDHVKALQYHSKHAHPELTLSQVLGEVEVKGMKSLVEVLSEG